MFKEILPTTSVRNVWKQKKTTICNLIVRLKELITGIQFLITFFEEFTLT